MFYHRFITNINFIQNIKRAVTIALRCAIYGRMNLGFLNGAKELTNPTPQKDILEE